MAKENEDSVSLDPLSGSSNNAVKASGSFDYSSVSRLDDAMSVSLFIRDSNLQLQDVVISQH